MCSLPLNRTDARTPKEQTPLAWVSQISKQYKTINQQMIKINVNKTKQPKRYESKRKSMKNKHSERRRNDKWLNSKDNVREFYFILVEESSFTVIILNIIITEHEREEKWQKNNR